MAAEPHLTDLPEIVMCIEYNMFVVRCNNPINDMSIMII